MDRHINNKITTSIYSTSKAVKFPSLCLQRARISAPDASLAFNVEIDEADSQTEPHYLMLGLNNL